MNNIEHNILISYSIIIINTYVLLLTYLTIIHMSIIKQIPINLLALFN